MARRNDATDVEWKETQKIRSAKHYQEHPGLYAKRAKVWQDTHPGKTAIHRMKTHMRIRKDAQDILGGKCVVCGEIDRAVLQFDHINDDGAEHRKSRGNRGSSGMDVWVIDHPEEAKVRLQLLCANDHARKHTMFYFMGEED